MLFEKTAEIGNTFKTQHLCHFGYGESAILQKDGGPVYQQGIPVFQGCHAVFFPEEIVELGRTQVADPGQAAAVDLFCQVLQKILGGGEQPISPGIDRLSCQRSENCAHEFGFPNGIGDKLTVIQHDLCGGCAFCRYHVAYFLGDVRKQYNFTIYSQMKINAVKRNLFAVDRKLMDGIVGKIHHRTRT